MPAFLSGFLSVDSNPWLPLSKQKVELEKVKQARELLFKANSMWETDHSLN